MVGAFIVEKWFFGTSFEPLRFRLVRHVSMICATYAVVEQRDYTDVIAADILSITFVDGTRRVSFSRRNEMSEPI